DLRRFPGTVGLVFPKKLMSDTALAKHKPANAALVKTWIADEQQHLTSFMQKGRFDHARCLQMQRDVQSVAGRSMVSLKGGGKQVSVVQGLTLAKGASLPLFLRIGFPAKAKAGASWEFTVVLRSRKQKSRVAGGATYRVEVVPKPKKT